MRTRRGNRGDGSRGGVPATRIAGGPATLLVALALAGRLAAPVLVALGCGGAADDAGGASPSRKREPGRERGGECGREPGRQRGRR